MNLHTIARAANYPRQAQITEPQICSNASLSVPVGGVVAALADAGVQLGRDLPLYARDTGERDHAGEPEPDSDQKRGRHPVGPDRSDGAVQHCSDPSTIWWRASKAARRSRIPSAPATPSTGSIPFPTRRLLNPNEAQPFAGTGYITSIVHTKSKSVGLYFIDTMKLGRLFELSGGVRWDRFNTGYNLYQPTPPAGGTVTAAVPPISRLDEQPSYRAAICLQAFDPRQSLLRLRNKLGSRRRVAEPERRPGQRERCAGRECVV